MQVTQSYARPSSATQDAQGSKFNFSAELSRKPVSINALILNSLGYARLMLALRKVVKGDWRTPQKDHSAYQEWVSERYIEALPDHLKGIEAEKVRLLEKREQLKIQQRKIQKEIQPIQEEVNKARRLYFDWLYKHDREKWIVLDPVISVHPDAIIFEAFSLDESSYGRVSIPSKLLETFGKTEFGTTNIDFSQALADEMYRVRSYRPAFLNVEFEKVKLATSVSSNVEKKIDLPETWVKGFLQVQSASTLDGTNLTIEAQTLSRVLAELELKKEKASPRSIRFVLQNNLPIKLVIDPWGIELTDAHIYQGADQEIRLWGRRRLFVLQDVLPYCEDVKIKLLGTGMPSYWTVELEGHRFDLGLSGWTDNNWANQASFDLLASSGDTKQIDMQKVEHILIQKLSTTPQEVANLLRTDRAKATTALQELCKNGQAMYDHLTESYRWRQLLQQDIKLSPTEEDERLQYAVALIREKQVEILSIEKAGGGITEYVVGVQGKNFFKPNIHLDLDGRIRFADCGCSFHRRNKLRQGPCQHIMAGVIWISKNN